ncbi:hypothetical protein BIFGAL_02905 [Bifidobacterium gallicum DSM 20093 = LMG 11596]|uniref:Uncharacterized protein n=1 Tax=Bifidobacterium gallicum DSM 20093 = LMG 11596 TaxID=561180 RepID=D1NSZ4_9BIFI|nr:hypothetical protein BIFGAL_02905 [Bifidobacterium gallicum DSM 20093 = LMG 11596]
MSIITLPAAMRADGMQPHARLLPWTRDHKGPPGGFPAFLISQASCIIPQPWTSVSR